MYKQKDMFCEDRRPEKEQNREGNVSTKGLKEFGQFVFLKVAMVTDFFYNKIYHL